MMLLAIFSMLIANEPVLDGITAANECRRFLATFGVKDKLTLEKFIDNGLSHYHRAEVTLRSPKGTLYAFEIEPNSGQITSMLVGSERPPSLFFEKPVSDEAMVRKVASLVGRRKHDPEARLEVRTGKNQVEATLSIFRLGRPFLRGGFGYQYVFSAKDFTLLHYEARIDVPPVESRPASLTQAEAEEVFYKSLKKGRTWKDENGSWSISVRESKLGFAPIGTESVARLVWIVEYFTTWSTESGHKGGNGYATIDAITGKLLSER
jgi:hypothetical protein